MNFGGPVWHASGRGFKPGTSYGIAERALQGVGDASKGEWIERGVRPNGAVHIRRRLTDEEQRVVGDVLDIRGTLEEAHRLGALLCDAPHLKPLLNFR